MDPELLPLDDLPEEARALIDEAESGIGEIQDRARGRTDEIQARAAAAIAEIEARAEEEVRGRQRQLAGRLKPLQDQYAREGKLDEALAIRERLRSLRASLARAQPDPGNLQAFREMPPGTRLLFDLVGSTEGVVWGTDVYTSDSRLAAAAVHAGILGDGERGVVRVVLVDTLNVHFTGSHRHGVWSDDFGPWAGGYRLERP